MEKLKLHSPNLTDDNITKIAALFPNCVTEAKSEKGTITKSIDFDQLRQEHQRKGSKKRGQALTSYRLRRSITDEI